MLTVPRYPLSKKIPPARAGTQAGRLGERASLGRRVGRRNAMLGRQGPRKRPNGIVEFVPVGLGC